MANDEQAIRHLIRNWAAAVHDGDLERVLADHTEDIVMFDVPPPNGRVRGRKDAGRWVVAHEHHSFPDKS